MHTDISIIMLDKRQHHMYTSENSCNILANNCALLNKNTLVGFYCMKKGSSYIPNLCATAFFTGTPRPKLLEIIPSVYWVYNRYQPEH